MNRRVRIVVALVFLLGAVASVLMAVVHDDEGFGSPVALVVGAVLLALGTARPLLLAWDDEDAAFPLDDAVLVVLLAVLPPLGVHSAYVLGVVLGCLWAATPAGKLLFNVGQVALATVVSVSVFRVVNDGAAAHVDVQLVVAAITASLAQTVVSSALLGLVLSATAGTTLRHGLRLSLRFNVLQWTCGVSVGLLVAVAAVERPWAAVFAVLPSVMVFVVLREHLKARRDRRRLDGLLQATVAAHASVRPGDVVAAVAASACELLRCREADVSFDPPGPGQLGVRLPLSGERERFLVVSGPKDADAFGPDELQLLEALVAVAAGALENAHLVDHIRRQATTDSLTGLPNQFVLDDRAEVAFTRSLNDHESVAIVALDLDGFQRVNESFGHARGNDLLKVVAARLLASAGDGATVARMSGDQFSLLLPGMQDPNLLEARLQRVLTELRRPILVDGCELYVTASLGAALFPHDGTSVAELLRNADTAMVRAKAGGGNGYRLYDVAMNEHAAARLTRQSELRGALRRRELRVLYQPQVDLRTDRIVGVEALVRWEHPTHGLLPPGEFVPLAEESDLIVDLDLWVLRHACLQAVAWDQAGLPPLRIGVNFSARHFADDRVVGSVVAVLAATGLDPARLEVEVTETVALGESEGTFDVLQQLRQLGVHLAIDDFGTGYSALAQMQRFPVDRLKIDRAFVNQITSAAGPAPIVDAFIAVARALHLDVVAEGVETLEQQAFLRAHGCWEVQGFLYSRPVPAEALEHLVRTPSLGLAPPAVSS